MSLHELRVAIIHHRAMNIFMVNHEIHGFFLTFSHMSIVFFSNPLSLSIMVDAMFSLQSYKHLFIPCYEEIYLFMFCSKGMVINLLYGGWGGGVLNAPNRVGGRVIYVPQS